MKALVDNNLLTGLFSHETRLEAFLKISNEIYSDMKYCLGNMEGYLSSNKADKDHMEISRRADSLLLAMDIVKKAAKDQIRLNFYSEDRRAYEYSEIDKRMRPIDRSISSIPRGNSYGACLIKFDKCRQFNVARMTGLKKNNPSSERYLDMAIDLMNEFKGYYDI